MLCAWALIQFASSAVPGCAVVANEKGARYLWPRGTPSFFRDQRISWLAQQTKQDPSEAMEWIKLAMLNLPAIVVQVERTDDWSSCVANAQWSLDQAQQLKRFVTWEDSEELFAVQDATEPVDPQIPHRWVPMTLRDSACAFCDRLLIDPVHQASGDTIPQEQSTQEAAT